MPKYTFKDKSNQVYERKKFILNLLKNSKNPMTLVEIQGNIAGTEHKITSLHSLRVFLERMREHCYVKCEIMKKGGHGYWSAIPNAEIAHPLDKRLSFHKSKEDNGGIYHLLDRPASWNSQPLKNLGKTFIGSSMGEAYYG